MLTPPLSPVVPRLGTAVVGVTQLPPPLTGEQSRSSCLSKGTRRAIAPNPKKGRSMYISIGAAILIIILLIIFVF